MEIVLKITNPGPIIVGREWIKKYAVNNKHGFRDKNYSFKKPKDVFRILIFGDSFTFGHGIKRLEDTYHKKLEMLLNQNLSKKKFEVLSMVRYDGGSTDTQLYELFERGFKYDPDLVIIGYYHNDLPIISNHDCREQLEIKYEKLLDSIDNLTRKSRFLSFLNFRTKRLLGKLGVRKTNTECLNRLYNSRSLEIEKIYLDTFLNISKTRNFPKFNLQVQL
jgi:hypothetical protein